jgi:hypothetical protein
MARPKLNTMNVSPRNCIENAVHGSARVTYADSFHSKLGSEHRAPPRVGAGIMVQAPRASSELHSLQCTLPRTCANSQSWRIECY